MAERSVDELRAELRNLGYLTHGIERWYELDVTRAAQVWVDRPDSNYGLLLIGSGETAKRIAMASGEYPVVTQRPILTIEYHIPEPVDPIVPIPGDALLAGGLLIPARGEPPASSWSLPLT